MVRMIALRVLIIKERVLIIRLRVLIIALRGTDNRRKGKDNRWTVSEAAADSDLTVRRRAAELDLHRAREYSRVPTACVSTHQYPLDAAPRACRTTRGELLQPTGTLGVLTAHTAKYPVRYHVSTH